MRCCAVALLTVSLLAAACGTPYVVRRTVLPGETVATLASRSGVTEEEIRRLNRMGPTDAVRPGDSVFLPGAPVARTPARPAAMPREPVPRPAPPEAIQPSPVTEAPLAAIPTPTPRSPSAPAERPAGAPQLQWPTAAGELVRGFGRSPAGENRGIDIGVPLGTSVRAAAAGRVTYAGTPARAYGPLVILDHGGEYHTVYANLRELSVKRGDALAAGQVLGTSGEQATAPMPHVHFEVRHKGEPVDPLLLLPPR